MEIPTQLFDVQPMPSLPDPPIPGESRQIYWWRAFCDPDGLRYWIENCHGELLAQHESWEKLCAELGWYPGRSKTSKTKADPPRCSAVRPAMCDDELDEIRARGEKVIGLHKPKRPLEQRPDPPGEGESVEILGYRVTRRTLSGKLPRTYYYAYDQANEIVSFAENWADWCHHLNWFPRDDLEAGQSIPREAKPDGPPRPKARTAPAVLNRHHYRTRDEIPEPWIYMGRGHVLGNPFVVVTDDPEIRSTLAEDPKNPEHRSSIDALTRYKRWLWDKICKRDLAVLRELGKITPEMNLVCSCAPRPCHLDVVVRAWKWAKGRTVLDGYGTVDEAEPEWVGSTSPSGLTEAGGQVASSTNSEPALVECDEPDPCPPAEGSTRPEPENLSLFGDVP